MTQVLLHTSKEIF